MSPPPRGQTNPVRRGKRDLTRKQSDFATLGEVAAIVNEGNRRQKEYFDHCFNSFVQEYEAREARKSFMSRIRRFFTRAPDAPHLPPEYLPPREA